MQNKVQDRNLYIIIGLFIIVIASLSYYIFANTVLKNRVLANTKLDGQDISLFSPQQLDNYYLKNIKPSLPGFLEVKMDNFTYHVPIENLNVQLNSEEIVSYGKGPNFVETLVKGVSTFKGNELTSNLKVYPQAVTEMHPYVFNSIESAFVGEDGKIENCLYNSFQIEFDYQILEKKIVEALRTNTALVTTIGEVSKNPQQTRIIYYCDYYRENLAKINNTFDSFNGLKNIPTEKIFGLYETFEGPQWRVVDKTLLTEELYKYKSIVDVQPTSSSIEYVEGKTLILQHAKPGRLLDIEDTVANIETWLFDISQNPNFDFELATSNEYLGTKDVYDFTNLISSGKTRLDIIRNGTWNWAVPIAQAGVEELHNTIIYPGQEFSYIGHVKPQPGNVLVMASGRPLGGGTCNSTTTLFRAVLEAGLPITARSGHTFMVDSYAWGPYPLNIVEATYYYNPNVDLRFVNDFNYPILLKSRIHQENDGFQYHTIDIFTDSRVQKREVTLTNWQQYNIITPRKFTGSFDRIVKENGQVLRTDTFISKYGDPVRY